MKKAGAATEPLLLDKNNLKNNFSK